MEAQTAVLNFTEVAIYRVGMFGVQRIDAKTATVTTGQKYAQYNDAVKVVFLQKGKRKEMGFLESGSMWLRVVQIGEAITPPSGLGKADATGSRMSTYTSYDPRYITDFEDALKESGARVLFEVGLGAREGAHLDRCKAMDKVS